MTHEIYIDDFMQHAVDASKLQEISSPTPDSTTLETAHRIQQSSNNPFPMGRSTADLKSFENSFKKT